MNVRFAIIAILLTGTQWASAQHVAQEPSEDPVQKAIREFNRQDTDSKTNEVTVVLPPPEEESTPAKSGDTPADGAGEETKEPVLVTGNPPQNSELVGEESDKVPDEPTPEEAEGPARDPQKGLAVHVSKLQSGTGTIDPAEVKLLAPFPAKPLSQPPAGWHLETPEDAPHFTREVELSPGTKITLTIRPHILVPDADGATVLNVQEPGFDPALGYGQKSTVGAVLAKSIRQLDEDSKQLGYAIDNLQQLLVSLPKAEPQPEPAQETPKAETTRKR